MLILPYMLKDAFLFVRSQQLCPLRSDWCQTGIVTQFSYSKLEEIAGHHLICWEHPNFFNLNYFWQETFVLFNSFMLANGFIESKLICTLGIGRSLGLCPLKACFYWCSDWLRWEQSQPLQCTSCTLNSSRIQFSAMSLQFDVVRILSWCVYTWLWLFYGAAVFTCTLSLSGPVDLLT